MGKSQRYQAAVDGHCAVQDHWIISEKTMHTRRPEPEYELCPYPGGSWGCLPDGFAMLKSPNRGLFLFVEESV